MNTNEDSDKTPTKEDAESLLSGASAKLRTVVEERQRLLEANSELIQAVLDLNISSPDDEFKTRHLRIDAAADSDLEERKKLATTHDRVNQDELDRLMDEDVRLVLEACVCYAGAVENARHFVTSLDGKIKGRGSKTDHFGNLKRVIDELNELLNRITALCR